MFWVIGMTLALLGCLVMANGASVEAREQPSERMSYNPWTRLLTDRGRSFESVGGVTATVELALARFQLGWIAIPIVFAGVATAHLLPRYLHNRKLTPASTSTTKAPLAMACEPKWNSTAESSR